MTKTTNRHLLSTILVNKIKKKLNWPLIARNIYIYFRSTVIIMDILEGRTSFFMDVVLQCHGYRMIQKTLLVLAIDWRTMLIRCSYQFVLNVV